jgi:hypothetical protein
MLVKCQGCGEKIDKDIAFKIVVKNVNRYYCTESEYLNIANIKKTKDNTYLYINDIFGYKVVNTVLFKEINEIANTHTYLKISNYIYENNKFLCSAMQKDFNNEYCKIKYFTAILKNNLSDYIINKEISPKKIEIDIPKDNYKPKIRRKSLLEFEQEDGE